MNYSFSYRDIQILKPHQTPEWTMTLGNGGFVSGSINHSLFRHHHGYLVASLLPPTNRFVILAKTEEAIAYPSKDHDQSPNFNYFEPITSLHQQAFVYDGLVTTYYRFNETVIEKTIVPYYGHNAVGIRYVISKSKALKFAISPLFNVRPSGDVSPCDKPNYTLDIHNEHLQLVDNNYSDIVVHVQWKNGTIRQTENKVGPIHHWFDEATGDNRVDYGFIPFVCEVALSETGDTRFELIVSVNEIVDCSVDSLMESERLRQEKLIQQAGYNDELAQALVIAADQFIVQRESTHAKTILAGLPWFADWGRDTMIAFGGLVLQSKRYEEAKQILKSFAKYEAHGLIPNMFPDAPNPPLYNTVDASLWYFQAIYSYYQATQDALFIQKELLPAMKRILLAYQKGTLFSIHMDTDGLIHAGSGIDQVTWMDVRINNIVVTPRHGKPVEINALWYNALKITQFFYELFGEPTETLSILAHTVKQSFNHKFWNPERRCLYDVIDEKDDSIRPNQIYATSLSFPVLSLTRSRQVLRVVKNELLDYYGLRTLSIHDPRFISTYEGPIIKRDFAYHMGTTWPFLLGGYCEGVLKSHRYSKSAFTHVKRVISKFKTHLQEGSLNGIAEIFDGLNGTISRGCHTQAWSVGEVLRIYTQYVLQEDYYETR